MSLIHRGILFSLVALVLGIAPVGCASSSAPDEADLATAAADTQSSREALVSATGLDERQQAKLAQIDAERGGAPYPSVLGAHRQPTIDQIVRWFTENLDLTPPQAAKLRAYLEAHMPH